MDKTVQNNLDRLKRLSNDLNVRVIACQTYKTGIIPMGKDWGNTPQSRDFLDENANSSGFSNFGIVTGPFSDNLEVIDIDTKVFKTAKEKSDFTKEIFNFLEDNIADLYSKISVYGTKSGGYHLLYKASNAEKTQKLAYPSGDNVQASIETRGGHMKDGKFLSGYVNFYPDFHVNGLTYEQIKYITDEDRNNIIQCCKALSHRPVGEKKKIKPEKTHSNEITGDSTWVDYNNKTEVWDLISDGFDIVRNLTDKIIVCRHNASSPHSGYIYKDSGCLFLFSTGTIYPAEELLSPYAVFTHKYHGGDWSASAKDLYSKGFGSRVSQPPTSKPTAIAPIEIEIEEEKTNYGVPKGNPFPLDVFPDELRGNLEERERVLGLNADFMAAGILWSAALMMGNSWGLEIQTGYVIKPSIWIACVAEAGIGKSPAINATLDPLKKINIRELKQYKKECDKYLAYMNKSIKEKEICDAVEKPINKQFIATDTTLEALLNLCSENPNGTGIYFDELAGFFNSMDKYRSGSDEQFWLSSWSGETHITNRVGTGVSIAENPHLPIIGGIQPGVLAEIATKSRQESGFMHRFLFACPKVKPEYRTREQLPESVITWLQWYMEGIKDKSKRFEDLDDEGTVRRSICKMDTEANNEYDRVERWIVDLQRSDEQSEYLKAMYSKTKSYLGKFTLICHYLKYTLDDTFYHLDVTKDSVLAAEKLIKYFIENASNIVSVTTKTRELKDVLSQSRNAITTIDKIKAVVDSGVKFTQEGLARELNVGRSHISKVIKKLKDKK